VLATRHWTHSTRETSLRLLLAREKTAACNAGL
jgi:hypothetical protein